MVSVIFYFLRVDLIEGI